MILTEDILNVINDAIKEEHGVAVTIDSLLIDSDIDSFGITMVLLKLDEQYAKFSADWVSMADIPTLTVRVLIERVQNESN